MPATVNIIIQQSSSGSAVADVKKDLGDLGSSAKDAGGGFSVLGEIATGALRKIGELALGAAIDGIKAIGGAISDGISDARQSAKLYASTEQTIKTMGNAAGRSAKDVVDLATALSDASGKSLFGDDQIQQSENLLLTFGNIRGEAFDLATTLTVDLAQALGGEPKDQAMMLGKALNDPIKGITALGKAGLTFSQEQKDMIKALVETGDMAGAQSIILEELNNQVGGQAAAAAKADGGWAQFNARLGEAKESIGAAILPLLGKMAGFLNDTIAPAVEWAAAAFSAWLGSPAVVAGIQSLVDGFGLLTGALGTLYQYWIDAGDATNSFVERIGYVIDTLIGVKDEVIGPFEALGIIINDTFAGMAATFSDASTPIEGLLNVLSQISPMFAVLRGIVEAALPPIQQIVMTVFGIISGFIQEHGAKIQADLTAAWQAIQGLINAVLPPLQAIVMAVFGAIATFLTAHGDEIKAFLGQTWDTIAQIVMLAVQLIQAIIVPIFTAIAAFITENSGTIQSILEGVWTTITSIINIALAVIKGVITVALDLIKGNWQGAWEAIKTMASTVWENLKTIFNTALEAIKAILLFFFNDMKTKFDTGLATITLIFTTVWDKIKLYFQGILDGMVGWVQQTLQGIVNAIGAFAGQAMAAAGRVGDGIVKGISQGIQDGASAIINAAKDAAMDALNAAKSALGIGSPSKLFASEIGKPMAQGMAVGLAGGAPLVAGAAQYAAGAALEGGSAVADSYNRSVTMNITNNLSGTDGMDYSLAASLAGV